MKISLTPVRRDDTLVVTKAGDILTINGDRFNFSSLPDGATYPAGETGCEWIAGPVERFDGALHLTLILPHGPDPSHEVAFPSPIIDPPDGLVVLPETPPAPETEDEEADDVDA